MLQPFDDNYFMKQAFIEAEKAFEKDEVPVGAVLVAKNKIIARTHNLSEQLTDFTAHAEMQAFTAGSSFLDNKYLNECTLYVTLEPCVMCAGAAFWTRLGRLVYGAKDERRGYARITEKILHPVTKVTAGIMEEECGAIMKQYFAFKR